MLVRKGAVNPLCRDADAQSQKEVNARVRQDICICSRQR